MKLERLCFIFLGCLFFGALFTGFIEAPAVNVDQLLLAPSWKHWFGTDSLGRDLTLRVLEGSRISLLLGIGTTLGTFVLGILYAVFSSQMGGWKDQVAMRVVEVLMGLPSIVLIAVLVLFFSNIWVERNLATQLLILTLSLTLSSWMWVARQVRTWIETISHLEYVQAARALGASPTWVVWKHILPNLSNTLLVFVGLQIPQHLLFESFLSFVGLGIQPPTASWGVLIQEGWKALAVYPHLILIPSGVLFATVFSFNYIFESFRDELDPRMKLGANQTTR
jgi:oligopeptide transport system permease protein